jgi:hypothetical protein
VATASTGHRNATRAPRSSRPAGRRSELNIAASAAASVAIPAIAPRRRVHNSSESNRGEDIIVSSPL